MSNQGSKISVITPTFNASKYIAECIESVSNQNYPNLEHWIIDGLSTDNTMQIVKEYAQKYSHIKYISEKDKGIYDAMNKGIDLATGDFLLFLGSDDKMLENVLYKIFSDLDVERYDLIYAKVQYPTYTCGKEFQKEYIDTDTLLQPFVHLFIHHQGSFIKKNLFKKFGKYDLRYPIGADVHFFIKVLGDLTVKKKFVDEIITLCGAEGVSSKKDELRLTYEFPDLIKFYLNMNLDEKAYYRGFSKYFFHKMLYEDFWEGFYWFFKVLIKTKDTSYIKDALYCIKKRILNAFTCGYSLR